VQYRNGLCCRCQLSGGRILALEFDVLHHVFQLSSCDPGALSWRKSLAPLSAASPCCCKECEFVREHYYSSIACRCRAGADQVVAAEMSGHMADAGGEVVAANGLGTRIMMIDKDARRMDVVSSMWHDASTAPSVLSILR